MSVTNDHFYAEIERLEKQITKLKAERDNWKALAERSEERVSEVKDERDRLTIIADAIQAERDRLRAALLQIAKADNTAWDMCEMARRALGGDK